MTFKENLEKDMLLGISKDTNNQKTFVKPKKNLYFAKYFDGRKVFTIRDIVQKLGYDYSKIIEQMERRVKEGEIGIVECHMMKDDIKKEISKQKVLDFAVVDENTGKRYLNGGIVMQDGKISFHT